MAWGTLMVDATRWSMSSAIDATNESLDRLFQATRARTLDGALKLEAAVARLDEPVGTGLDESTTAPREALRDERGERSARPDPAPFVPLPQRTTHGGPFGPKVRDKLTREALAKRGWW